jgi:hypothetical protein
MASRMECPDRRLGDMLAAYEQGLLDEEERAAFEAHLAGCEECLDELYEMAPYVVAMLADPGRYRRIAAAAAALDAPTLAERLGRWLTSVLTPRVAVPVAVAAVLVVAVIVGTGNDARKLGRLAVVEHVPYVQLDTRAWGDEAAVALFDLGMRSYVDRDYGAAATRLAEAIAAAPADGGWAGLAQARFYLGVSRLLSGETREAVAPLAQAARSPLVPVAERARWELAQAHLLLGDAGAARAELERLAESPVFGERARAQLAEIGHLEQGE